MADPPVKSIFSPNWSVTATVCAAFVVANGLMGRITDEIATGPVAKHGFQSLAAYGLPAEKALAAYRERLTLRLREALGTADDERIRTEIAVFAGKIDIDEELTRLVSHIDECERILGCSDPAGKRLEFLAQELNREANTLASKAADPRIGECALEIRVLIEQLREQVQNIE